MEAKLKYISSGLIITMIGHHPDGAHVSLHGQSFSFRAINIAVMAAGHACVSIFSPPGIPTVTLINNYVTLHNFEQVSQKTSVT